jgi:acetyl-CoA synthetase (ADP-forming)
VPVAVDKTGVRAIVEGALQRGGGWLTIDEAQHVLERAAIPVAAARMVTTEDAAVDAAGELGFPVALKAVGPELLHKTDVGGVCLDLGDTPGVVQAYRDFRARLGDRLTGVLVQRMAPSGVELLVGLLEDETFGPVVLCSLGGTLVELLGRPVVRLLPLDETDIDELLHEMPGSELLRGYRGCPPVDDSALRDLLGKVSSLAESFPEVLEMDLNPVRLFERGLAVVDVRIRVGRHLRLPSSRRISY